MSRYPYKNLPLKKSEHNNSNFKVKKTVRLGTDKAPAQITVQTEERKQELANIFAENGWVSVIKVDPEQDENIRDLEILQNKQSSAVSTKKANRNDPCPCNSSKKYKKCCGA
ncbi:PBPRA1643 family SWIM/SEC-C metal-binding motif protein [Spartinivicinus ruber]|uniref:PBPRA1643 family SWIM/SEC-C metal-binding motif protein n=1 Tax=Spartinivicinus ruber TaxID=2683272 RepID=UPI0013D28721|nr:PBPRA1643 family SWIM/SEC-C metal-binding motif protein [Spartinivicinus ruber]